MTDVSDLYEPGDDREPDEPEQEPPLDLDAVEESIRIYYSGSDDDSGKAAEELVTVVAGLATELREARQRIAEFEALPTREEWAVTGRRDIAPSKSMPLLCESADSAAKAVKVSGGVLWVRRLTVHPWEPISPEAPF